MHPIGKGNVTHSEKKEAQLSALYKDENARTVKKENIDKVENELKNLRNKNCKG